MKTKKVERYSLYNESLLYPPSISKMVSRFFIDVTVVKNGFFNVKNTFPGMYIRITYIRITLNFLKRISDVIYKLVSEIAKP